MKKQIAVTLLTGCLCLSSLACYAQEEGNASIEGTNLEIAVTYNEEHMKSFQPLVDKFMEETGVNVEIATYGDDYESTLKVRMASNELPDIWQTHGWSVLRYKEYLMDLSNEPWVSDYDDSAYGVIQDDEGKIYVLMTSEMLNGTLVNLEICEEAGVDPYSIHTWDDFIDACDKVKDAGYVPLGMRAIKGAGMANIAGTFVTYPGAMYEDGEAQLDGTWDWNSYQDSLVKFWARCAEKDYFYEDTMTLEATQLSERFAQNKAAFLLGNDPSVLVVCKNLNPEGEYALLPSFASTQDGAEYIGVGEGDAYGIWKDTENEAGAKAFLEFMARPENAKVMNDATGKISCLKSSMGDDESYGLQLFDELKEKKEGCNIYYENLWDRQWMPSGMWGIFVNAGDMLLDDWSEEGQEEVIEYLKENYVDLWESAHEE